MFENGLCGEGEWSGLLEKSHHQEVGYTELLESVYQQAVIHALKENLYFIE